MENINALKEWIIKPHVYEKALQVSILLAKVSFNLQTTFIEPTRISNIFTYIESKYTNKIEGINVTLFDVVNCGTENKLIKPIVDELFRSKEMLDLKKVLKLEEVLNFKQDREKRFAPDFGIYSTKDDKKTLIYKPPTNKDYIESELKQLIEKMNKDESYIDIICSHILFEKLHPFVDANGRIGRLLFQKSMAKILSFSNVLPLSWAFFKNRALYYESLDVEKADDLNESLLKFFYIFESMCKTIDAFNDDVKKYKDKFFEPVRQIAKKNEELTNDILFSLQTKKAYVISAYHLNDRTIDSMFDKLSSPDIDIPFNRKRISTGVAYWNTELEGIIDKHFGG